MIATLELGSWTITLDDDDNDMLIVERGEARFELAFSGADSYHAYIWDRGSTDSEDPSAETYAILPIPICSKCGGDWPSSEPACLGCGIKEGGPQG